MAGMAERGKEWQNSRMAEMATYVLFMVHTDDVTDDDDNNTVIFKVLNNARLSSQFYSCQSLRHIGHSILIISIKLNMSKEQHLLDLLW